MPDPSASGDGSISAAELAELRSVAQRDRDELKVRLKALNLKLGERLRLYNELMKVADKGAAVQPPPPPVVRPQLRVCFVCTANAFVYDDSPTKRLSAKEQGGDMRIRPTGGLTLTYAMVRYLLGRFGAERCAIIALDYVFPDPPCFKQWEGHTIIRATPAQMPDALRAYGLLDRWDVVLSANLSPQVVGFVNAHLAPAAPHARHGARHRVLKAAMCHDYSGSPFGPWSHLEETVDRGELRAALAGWALLCDSQHTAAYMVRHAAREGVALATARCSYGASSVSYTHLTLPTICSV